MENIQKWPTTMGKPKSEEDDPFIPTGQNHNHNALLEIWES